MPPPMPPSAHPPMPPPAHPSAQPPAHPPVLSPGQPMIPDPARYGALVQSAFDAGRLSNSGPLHDRLERALAARIKGGAVALTSSGTMALMLALRLGQLPPGSEVITTPLSFAASLQAIEWCGLVPVLADVDPDCLTLCPGAVEAAITPRTSAILAVHFLGTTCRTDALAAIAARHGLWLVYDGAHAFGVQAGGHDLGLAGDATAFSLHATKLLHTGEGGLVVTRDPGHRPALEGMRNFGLRDGQVAGPGINGKMSELHAAMGLALLPDLEREITARAALSARYTAGLSGLAAITIQRQRAGASTSLLYYSLRMAAGLKARVLSELAAARIAARDGFALLGAPGQRIHSLRTDPVAPALAPEVLCLPLHGRVSDPEADRIIDIIRKCCHGQSSGIAS